MQVHSAVQLPAPKGRVAGVGTRGNTGLHKPCDQFRHSSRRPSASARLAAPAARGSGCGHWHRRVPMHLHQICGNVFERRAQRKASFSASQTELRDAGLPGAKHRDADTRAGVLCLLSWGRPPATSKKVGRLLGRGPARPARPLHSKKHLNLKQPHPPKTAATHYYAA
jgi:hypothetical protein